MRCSGGMQRDAMRCDAANERTRCDAVRRCGDGSEGREALGWLHCWSVLGLLVVSHVECLQERRHAVFRRVDDGTNEASKAWSWLGLGLAWPGWRRD